MNRIEELEKQIKEIQETTEKKVKELQEEIRRLKEEKRNLIPREHWYAYIDVKDDGTFCLSKTNDGITTERYNNWHYFISESNAENF